MSANYLRLPFTNFESDYLESLPDEVFFSVRYIMSEEDKAILEENSTLVNGRKFYRARIRNPILEKYAALTNPKEGEPGSRSNPLTRFGKQYVYSSKGYLIPVVYHDATVQTRATMLTKEQMAMIRGAAKTPITYDSDCPKSNQERLERFYRFGSNRNKIRTIQKVQSYLSHIQSL